MDTKAEVRVTSCDWSGHKSSSKWERSAVNKNNSALSTVFENHPQESYGDSDIT